MEKRVYRYRSVVLLFAVGFLFVWSTGWLCFTIAPFFTGTVKINGRTSPAGDQLGFLSLMGLIGIGVLSFGLRLLGTYVYERVEISGADVLYYDWLGRLRVKCDLREVRVVEDRPGVNGNKKMRVGTDRGEFFVRSELSDYSDLRARLQSATQGEFTVAMEPAKAVAFLHAPAIVAETYRYRFSYLHLFSFLWLAMCAFIFGGALTSPSTIKGGIAPFVVGGLAFSAIGVWMQLTGWIERIDLGPQGIVWTDFLGRKRVVAALDEITGMISMRGNHVGVVKIETLHGTVQASSYLRGYSDLKAQVGAVLAAREPSTAA